MNKQYIGARYVPSVFSDENGSSNWRKEIPYEALTIVTYLGNSYTSKKPVPVNTEIDNNEYWVLTGNYNAQIEQLSSSVDELRNDIGKMSDRQFLIVSDSYGAEDNTNGNVDNRLYYKWPYYAQHALGVPNEHWHEQCISGSGFYTGEFREQIIAPYTDGLVNVITDIIIVGGLNDAHSNVTNFNQVIDKIYEFNNTARSRFPNLKNIYLGYAGNACDFKTEFLNGRTCDRRMTVRDIYNKTGLRCGWNIIPDLVESWSHGNHYVYDGATQGYRDYLHPTWTEAGSYSDGCGAFWLGSAVANFIKSGSADIYFHGEGANVLDKTIIPVFNSKTLTFNLSGCHSNYSGSLSNTPVKIGEISGPYGWNVNEEFEICNTALTVRDSNAVTFPARIQFKGSDILVASLIDIQVNGIWLYGDVVIPRDIIL